MLLRMWRASCFHILPISATSMCCSAQHSLPCLAFQSVAGKGLYSYFNFILFYPHTVCILLEWWWIDCLWLRNVTVGGAALITNCSLFMKENVTSLSLWSCNFICLALKTCSPPNELCKQYGDQQLIDVLLIFCSNDPHIFLFCLKY